MLDYGAQSAATLVLFALVAKANSVRDVGLYFLFLTAIFSLETIQRSIVSVPLSIFATKSPEGIGGQQFLGSMLVWHGLVQLALVCVLAAWVSLFPGLAPSETAVSIGSVLTCASALIFRDFARSVYVSHLDGGGAFRLGFSVSSATVIAVLVAYLTDRLNVENVFWILAVTNALPAAVGLWTYRDRIQITRRRLKSDIKLAVGYGKWVFAAVLTNAVGVRAIPWLLVYWHGNNEVAIFGALATAAGLINPLINGAFGYLTPALVKIRQQRGESRAFQVGAVAIGVALVVAPVYALLLWLGGDVLVRYIFSEEYSNSRFLLALLGLEVALKGANLVLIALFRAFGVPQHELSASVTSAAVTALAGWILIKHYASVGAAWTLLLAFAAVILINSIRAVRVRREQVA